MLRFSAKWLVALVVAAVPAAWGTQVNFTGVFTQDDNVQLFYYMVQNAGNVSVATTSFNALNPAAGGFSPILTLFDSTGQFLFDDETAFGAQTNSSLSWNSNAGAQYIVALTEYDNYSIASGDNGNLSEGFTEAGNGNFTANPPMNPGLSGGFYDGTGGPQTSGDWAVTFSAADALGLTATAVPEPGSWALLGTGIALLFGWRRRNRTSASKVQEG